MRTVRTKVYKFEELNSIAKDFAIENNSEINFLGKWWNDTYHDAAEIGLELTSFNSDSASFIYQLEGSFTLAANEVAQNILTNHGEICDTYKTAQLFMEVWQPSFNDYVLGSELEDSLMDIEDKFLTDLLKDYTKMLQTEQDDLASREAVYTTITENEMEFYADGSTFTR